MCHGLQFLNPFFMVKNGAKVPPGNVNDWFFMTGNLKDDLPKKLLPPGKAVFPTEVCFWSNGERLLELKREPCATCMAGNRAIWVLIKCHGGCRLCEEGATGRDIVQEVP